MAVGRFISVLDAAPSPSCNNTSTPGDSVNDVDRGASDCGGSGGQCCQVNQNKQRYSLLKIVYARATLAMM